MKRLAGTVWLCLCIAAPVIAASVIAAPVNAAAPHNTLSDDERAGGWQLLFDGQTLDGWRSYGHSQPQPAWQVHDATIALTSPGGGDLITHRTYADFELRMEWRISEAGNSGVFILADECDYPIFVHAPEIQVLDDARHPDNKLATHRSGSLYDLIAAPAMSQRPAGSWNTLRIRHQKGHLTVWQNQIPVADIHLDGEAWRKLVRGSKFADWQGFGSFRDGHIGLQDHGDPVAFRNIKLLEL